MTQYKYITETEGVIIEGNHSTMVAQGHARWVEFLAAGPAAWVEPEPSAGPVPQVISPYQARTALRNAGLLAAVQSAIASADEATQDAWEYATEWRRDSPTIAAIAETLELTPEQVDDLFCAAALIAA